MRILVTGGTGLVGSHAVAALIERGHDLRLLVRSPASIGPAFDPLGVPHPEHVTGDVTNAASVDAAMEGCDAVLHAAAVYSLDSRDAERIRRTNVPGARTVLGAAAARGLDPIVYISSFTAFFPPNGRVLRPDSPVTRPGATYAASKAEAERYARSLQANGAPITSIYPGVVLGPHDPHLGDNHQIIRNTLRGLVPMTPGGGTTWVDVRDLAHIVAASMEPGKGPRGYLAATHYATFPEVVRTLASMTGRRVPFVPGPDGLLLALGRGADALQRRLPWRLPFNFEGIYTLTLLAHCDDSATRRDLGLEPRDLQETLRDTVAWLAERGHLTPRQAGRLAR
ncbi:MAG TPA: NAD-dependent epimerase [Actinobacteria bacterium]|nr:NAD-dependent epimerase [Actinomycetota bacterium]